MVGSENYILKVFLLTIVSLLLVNLNAFAASVAIDQRILSHNSLLTNELSQLSIDHSQLFAGSLATDADQRELYAMADSSAQTQSRSSAQQKGGTSMEKWHKYLGYGTVLMAGVTAVSHSDEDFHESAAYVTAAGALSTLLTGYLAHSQRFDADEGLLTKDNLHIALGTLGAVLLTTAVAIADDGEESSHSGLGVIGGVLMTLGVIDIKW